MKLVEFRQGHPRTPEIRGDAVFVNPAYVVSVVAHSDDRDVSVITLAGGGVRQVGGNVEDVARRIAGAGVDHLPDLAREAFIQRSRHALSDAVVAGRARPGALIWA